MPNSGFFSNDGSSHVGVSKPLLRGIDISLAVVITSGEAASSRIVRSSSNCLKNMLKPPVYRRRVAPGLALHIFATKCRTAGADKSQDETAVHC